MVKRIENDMVSEGIEKYVIERRRYKERRKEKMEEREKIEGIEVNRIWK